MKLGKFRINSSREEPAVVSYRKRLASLMENVHAVRMDYLQKTIKTKEE